MSRRPEDAQGRPMRSLDSTLELAEIIDTVRGDIENGRPIAPLHAQRLLAYIDDLHVEAELTGDTR